MIDGFAYITSVGNTTTINLSVDSTGKLTGTATAVPVNLTLTGEATGSGTTTIAVTLTNSAVIGKVLTGYVSGAGTVAATDSILQAIQKLNGNQAALVTGVSSVNSLTGAVPLTGTVNRITISAANVFDIGTDIVTLTGSQALSNKTGLISQWTNDSGYITSIAGAVTSVSGTTNRITSSGGSTPVIDISASYVGQSSITTLGTIGTGIWQGTKIAALYGGTGQDASAFTGVAQWASGVYSASAALASGTTAADQTALDNSGKVANTKYVNAIPYCTRVNFPPQNTSSRPQGTWSLNFNGSQPGGQLFNSTSAQNDNVTYNFSIFGGSAYILQLTYFASTDKGIFTFLIDGVSVGTIDSYNSGGAAFGRISSVTGITITSGAHILTVKAATKNASSSGFGLFWSCLEIFT